MGLFNEKVISQTKDLLKEMRDPITLTSFSQEMTCEPCSSADAFIEELAAVDDRLRLEKKDFLRDRELAEGMGIHHIPALVLHRPDDGRPAVRYYGVPAGYEFGAFLRVLVLFSNGRVTEKVDPALLDGVGKDINLKVFVLVTCPSCPVMAHLCATLAFMSPRITTEIIEANTFVDLSTRFSVGAVPKIVINDTLEVVGVLPPQELVRRILAA